MREIKFRAWSEEDEVMLTADNMQGFLDIYMDVFTGEAYWRNQLETEFYGALMQYTGLKDKNGNEIFEGDILKITNTKRFCGKDYTCYSEVKVIDGHVYVWPHPIVDGEIKRFGAKLLFSGMAKYIKDKGVATDDVKIVGNIYENEKLLEEN